MPPVPKNAKKPVAPAREVKYPNLAVQVCRADRDTALTIDMAKSILGWEEETDTVKFNGDFLFIDHNKHKVRCTNNIKNRPFSLEWAKTISQRILRKRWRGLNGETMVINTYGDTESCQHRLIGFILAEQLRTLSDSQWLPHHPEELTLDCIIVFGVEPDEQTINTIDTGRTRTLSDVLYRSHYFAHLSADQRKVMSRATAHCIERIWKRTGADTNTFTLYPDHSEMIAFLENHPKMLEAVGQCHKLNKNNCLGAKPGPGLGYSAALMYLMACSETDGDLYREAEIQCEKVIEFNRWTEAIEFFKEFAYAIQTRPAESEFKPLVTAIGNLSDEDGDGSANINEVLALVVKAWHCFIDKKPITAAALKLRYHTDNNDVCRLLDYPTVGGIDKDKEIQQPKALAGDSIEARKKALQEEKEREERAKEEAREQRQKEPVDEFGFPLTYVEPDEQETQEPQEPTEEPPPEPKPAPKTSKPTKGKPDNSGGFVMSEAEKRLAAERAAKKPKA